jgi:hypothetical protein
MLTEPLFFPLLSSLPLRSLEQDQDKFFSDFAAVFHKLTELGVPTAQFAAEPWSMLTVDEAESSKK